MSNNLLILCRSTTVSPSDLGLNTNHSAAGVADALWPLMATTDLLMVVDASSDEVAWFGLDAGVDAALAQAWRPQP